MRTPAPCSSVQTAVMRSIDLEGEMNAHSHTEHQKSFRVEGATLKSRGVKLIFITGHMNIRRAAMPCLHA